MNGAYHVQVKFRYTRSYRDRHGKMRIEYRRRGKTIPLRGMPGTAEFQNTYDPRNRSWLMQCPRRIVAFQGDDTGNLASGPSPIG